MNKLGGWKINPSATQMPQKVASIFEKVEKVLGCTYKVIAYLGSQAVNGTNHAVLAQQTVITGEDVKNAVIMIFNEKPDSMDVAWVDTIPVVEGGGKFGGTEIDMTTEIPEKAKEAFDAAVDDVVGAKFEIVAYVGRQLVHGINHKFIITGQPVTANPDEPKKLSVATINVLGDKVSNMLVEPLLEDNAPSHWIVKANMLGAPLGEWP